MKADLDNEMKAEDGPATGADLIPTILRFVRAARYRKNVLFASLCVATLAATAYYLLATRYYQSSARLLIVKQNQDQPDSLGDAPRSDNTMATHSELVRSAVVLQSAIEKLAPQHRIDLQQPRLRDQVDALRKNISTVTTRKTNFIEVRCRSQQPEAAAAVVRAVINSYLNFVETTHKGSTGDVIQVLKGERARLQTDLAHKQADLQQFRQQVGHLALSSDDGTMEPLVQRAVRLNEALMKTQEKRLELQASLASIAQAIQNGEDVHQHLVSIEAVVGRQMMLSALGLSNQDMQMLSDQEQRMLQLQSELRSLSTYYGPAHPQIAELKREVATIETYLQNYRANAGHRFDSLAAAELGPVVHGMLKQAVAQASRKESQILASFEKARAEAARHSGELVQLQMLEREVARLETLHDVLFEKIAAIDIHQVQAPIQATVVEEPMPNLDPVSPQLRKVTFICLFCGLIAGATIIYVQDLLDDRFTSPEEMAAQLGVPTLAMIRELAARGGEGLETVHTNVAPNSVETEAFRTLRTALTLGADVTDRILISSSEPSDGKTTVTANLAVSFAQSGKKTLVIDADLRKPGMTALLGLKGVPGVADTLVADEDPTQVAARLVRTTDVAGLDVLPAGLRRPNPAELLGSQNFVELLAWADSLYDQVLVDCPPVLAVSDAQIVGRLVDGAILVVRPAKNHRRLVMRACESFAATGCKVLGIVANGITSEHANYGYGYGYGYGTGYGYGYSYGHETDDEVHDGSQPADAQNHALRAHPESVGLTGTDPAGTDSGGSDEAGPNEAGTEEADVVLSIHNARPNGPQGVPDGSADSRDTGQRDRAA